MTYSSESVSEVGNDSRAGKYLTFALLREEFGLRVQKVREIAGMQLITAVPQTPAYVKGVLNLRGKVIPIIDLRLKFGFPRAEIGERTCIVVVEVQTNSSSLLMGIVVDSVTEVINASADEIEDLPHFEDGCASRYLLGLVKRTEHITMLLDIDTLLNTQELHRLDAIAGN